MPNAAHSGDRGTLINPRANASPARLMYTKMSERSGAAHSQPLLAKMLVVALASLCLAGVAAKLAWAASPCSREGVTLVCKRADRDLRIVHDTLSPSGRYGFAWGFSTGDWTDRSVLPQVLERSNRGRMNTNFGNITDRLNAEHKRIVAAQPSAHGFQKGDMKAEFLIVAG